MLCVRGGSRGTGSEVTLCERQREKDSSMQSVRLSPSLYQRLLSVTARGSRAVSVRSGIRPYAQTAESKSFAVGIFKGQIQTEQIFPYPSVQTEVTRQSSAASMISKSISRKDMDSR
ncbi:hypothetical protein FKM82_008965 [Ascaphus truei]